SRLTPAARRDCSAGKIQETHAMRKLLALSVLLTAAAVAPAADTPTITARVRSVNDLTGYFEYLGGIGGQAEAAKQAVGVVKAMTDVKTGLEGIDPARPIGLYGVLTPDVIGSYAVLVLPVANEQAVLDLMTGKLNLDPKKGDDGVYEVAVPNVPVPVFFTFAGKSLYVTARAETAATALAAKNRIAPAVLFADKDDAFATVRVHLDRIPKTVRNTVLAQFELQMAQRKEKPIEGETPAQQKLRGVLLDAGTDALASTFADGQELALRLRVDPKTDDVAAELTLTGKPGTPLAKFVAAAGKTTGLASAIAAKDATMTFGARLTVPETLREKLAAAITAVLQETVESAPKDKKELATKGVAAVGPTLKAGEIDIGMSILMSPAGKMNMVGGLGVVDGRQIEKMYRDAIASKLYLDAIVKNPDSIEVKFDVFKANGIPVHRFESPGDRSDPIFGTNSFFLGNGDRVLLFGFEPDGKLVKAAAATKSTKVPVAYAELSAVRTLTTTEKGLPAEQVKKLADEVFPDGVAPGSDTFRADLTGGDALTLRVTLKGKALRLAMLVDQAKKAK
ncbi:MAG: hypothetical protein ACRC7O_10125, partial [Fimbriiglobus sp.]